MQRKKAEDFHVGQQVTCARLESFPSSLASYLRDRVGIVKKISPSGFGWPTGNRVQVLWQKRNGRGKEKSMVMHPEDLLPHSGE